MGWLTNLLANTNKTREEALRLGLTVAEVERELPIFDRANQFESLSLGKCVRYSLPRMSPHSTWELLQRDKKSGAQLPNGYLLKSQNTDPQFVDKFRPIAEDFSEEYFEFEGTSSDVAVFWEEWGGAEQAVKLQRVLLSLKDL